MAGGAFIKYLFGGIYPIGLSYWGVMLFKENHVPTVFSLVFIPLKVDCQGFYYVNVFVSIEGWIPHLMKH